MSEIDRIQRGEKHMLDGLRPIPTTHHHDTFDAAIMNLKQAVKDTMQDNTRLRSYIRRMRNDVADGVLDAGDAFHQIVGYALPNEPLSLDDESYELPQANGSGICLDAGSLNFTDENGNPVHYKPEGNE